MKVVGYFLLVIGVAAILFSIFVDSPGVGEWHLRLGGAVLIIWAIKELTTKPKEVNQNGSTKNKR